MICSNRQLSLQYMQSRDNRWTYDTVFNKYTEALDFRSCVEIESAVEVRRV